MKRAKKISQFSVNIDTLRGSTKVDLLVHASEFISKGWKQNYATSTSPSSYTKNANNIRFEYYPISGYIVVTFSAPKIMTGSNTGLFNFDEIDLFYDTLDVLIDHNIKGLFEVQSLKYWNATRIDINTDIPFLNDTQKRLFMDLFSKISVSRREKTNYSTGTRFKNKSSNATIYDKEQEILDRDPNKVTEADEMFLTDISATHARIEFQIKKTKLTNLYKKERSFEVLLTRETINDLYSYFINQFKLDKKFLTKENLFDFIDSNFKVVHARNMKRLVEDLNELTSEEFEKLHVASTKNAYGNSLRKLDVSIYYFSKDPGFVVDFSDKIVYYGKKPTLRLIDVMIKVVELILEKITIITVNNFKPFQTISITQLKQTYPDRGS